MLKTPFERDGKRYIPGKFQPSTHVGGSGQYFYIQTIREGFAIKSLRFIRGSNISRADVVRAFAEQVEGET